MLGSVWISRFLVIWKGEKSDMKKAIITGADGFVGSHTVRNFLDHGVEVLAVGRKETPQRLMLEKGLKYLQCDMSNPRKLIQYVSTGEYDTFVHFAWSGSAGAARIDCELQMENALHTVECIKVAKELGCMRFVGAGSIMEYEVEAAVHAQGNRPGMGYIYGMAKHVAHCMSKAVAAEVGIDLLWPMITNTYGIGEFSPRFVNTTLRKMIRGEQLQFTSGTQNYDFVYITDVAEAFYLIAESGRPFCEYMIGSGQAKTLKEFILEMQRSCAPQAVPIFGDVPFTGINMSLNTFDISQLTRDTGFQPKVSFSEGTKKTMEWLEQVENSITN